MLRVYVDVKPEEVSKRNEQPTKLLHTANDNTLSTTDVTLYTESAYPQPYHVFPCM